MPSNLLQKGFCQGGYIEGIDLNNALKEHIMTCRAIEKYRKKPIEKEHKLIILTQDCDISNPTEKYLEVLAAKKINNANVRVQKARNLQKLQIEIDSAFWECEVNKISHISKEFFEEHLPKNAKTLSDRSKEILLTWRVNRYTRQPLPDNFNHAFITNHLRNAETGFSNFFEENKDYIVDLYVYVNPDSQEVDNYDVSITALLYSNCSNEKEIEIREILLRHVKIIDDNESCLTMMQVNEDLEFDHYPPNMEIVAKPEDFSMQDSYSMKRLTLDYLCWPDDDENQ